MSTLIEARLTIPGDKENTAARVVAEVNVDFPPDRLRLVRAIYIGPEAAPVSDAAPKPPTYLESIRIVEVESRG